MVVNGIEILDNGNGIHAAILSRVADACLELGVYSAEQDDRGIWNGPLQLPKKAVVVTANKEMGVVFRVKLADGRETLESLPTALAIQLEEQGWL